jgi:hypothetical protein
MGGAKGLGVGLGLVMVVTLGCASAPKPLTWFKTEGAAAAKPRSCVAQQSRYTDADVNRILRLRDEGESLKYVATQVGGSRQEVKCAEYSALLEKREARYLQKR